jgi:hypothetical protein
MADVQGPVILSGDKTVTQLYQVTITADHQIENVNKLLSEGWRLLSVGYQPNSTVYVLGRMDEKPKHRPGFLAGE